MTVSQKRSRLPGIISEEKLERNLEEDNFIVW